MAWITLGDFVELRHKLRSRGWAYIAGKLRLRSADRVRATYNAQPGMQSQWWQLPAVRDRINQRITGDARTKYETYVCEKYLADKPEAEVLSLGCGNGEQELNFASDPNVGRVTGIDLAAAPIAEAYNLAAQRDIHNVEFRVDDVFAAELPDGQYDVVLFHSSLHHFKPLEQLLGELVPRVLKPDGLLIINEFVGPTRWQWTPAQLRRMNELLRRLPESHRRRIGSNTLKRRVYRPGLLRMLISDPSEAVRSAEILPQIHRRFDVVEEKPYGGNLLVMLLQDIAHHFANDEPESQRLLQSLFDEEDRFVVETGTSDYVFGVYRPKSAAAAVPPRRAA